MLVSYTVRCNFHRADPSLAGQWLDWLRDSHIAEVMAGGAIAAEIVQMSGEQTVYEVRYRFRSRSEFERYLAESAPALRAEGLRRFPVEAGVEYSRADGDVIFSM